ncbi:MAG: hypothetical protein ACJ8AI_04740, partial [Rhodopila sp.]
CPKPAPSVPLTQDQLTARQLDELRVAGYSKILEKPASGGGHSHSQHQRLLSARPEIQFDPTACPK